MTKITQQRRTPCGLRLLERLRLRVKDLDFERREITVREGKGDKDRVTMLPQAVTPALQQHLRHVEAIHQSRRCRRLRPRGTAARLGPQVPKPASHGRRKCSAMEILKAKRSNNSMQRTALRAARR